MGCLKVKGSSTEQASGQCCNGILEREKKGLLAVLALRGPTDNVAMEFW